MRTLTLVVSTDRIWIDATPPDPGVFLRILALGSKASWRPHATAEVSLVSRGGREDDEEVMGVE